MSGSRIDPVATSSSRSWTRFGSLKRSSLAVARPLGVRGSMRPPTSWKWSIQRSRRGWKSGSMDPVCSSIEARSLPFPGIADHAGQSQVVGDGAAPVLLGNDMVDRVDGPCHRLGNPAILAAFAGSFADLAAQRDGNMGHAHGRSLTPGLTLDGPGLGHTDEVLDVLITLPFPPFLVRQAAGTVLVEQGFDAFL